MTESVQITTGARLHFGLLVAGEHDRRTYGGIGLMIDEPGFALTVRKAAADCLDATPETILRLQELLSRLRQTGPCAPVEITVTREIPAHAGLGSGTQLGLAIAAAIGRLAGETELRAVELARRVSRGTRSAIGTIGFVSGGLIAQGTLSEDGSLTTVTQRGDFPDEWRFVLVTPRDYAGLSGDAERRAFRELPPLAEATLRELLGLQTQMMNWAAAREFDEFNEVLREFAYRVGEYFAPVQSGLFADWRMDELARHVDSFVGDIYAVPTCLGQTSWGPTMFVACRNADDAGDIVQFIHEYARCRVIPWDNLDVRIVAARNRGADVKSIE
jgi:beta-ribofuranosylaminobenzene 5'-phosphate synthase